MTDKNKGGRPSYEPTDKDRKTVQLMAAFKIPQDMIAEAMNIAPHTLRKHFSRELKIGTTVMVARVAQSLLEVATMPEHTSQKVSAAKAILAGYGGVRFNAPEAIDREDMGVGKKVQEARAAESAGRGTEWGDDLTPPGLLN